MNELNDKRERIMRLCHSSRLDGVLLRRQANFGWITGGRSNRIDGTVELGAGAMFITANGRVVLLANTIEMPRLLDEALAGISCEAVEYPWTDDHISQTPIRLARRVVANNDARIGADGQWAETISVADEVAELRARLTDPEAQRYRILGRDAAAAVGRVCRSIEPGISEQDVERLVADALMAVRARPAVVLIGTDERIARYRHPTPTSNPWHQLLLIVVCAERQGLTVALSRLVSVGPAPPVLKDRTAATAKVFERLLDRTRAGAAGRELYAEAVRAYADVGFAGEERRHHQGGAIGYQSRDWIAHPACDARVQSHQAFAWNPSITGTKVEETVLLTNGVMEVVTSTPDWPSMPIHVGATTLQAPLILQRD